MREIDDALDYMRHSLQILEDLQLDLFVPFAHLAVGNILQLQQQWDPAHDHYRLALARVEALRLTRATIQILYSIGEWHAEQQDLAQAQRFYVQACERAKASNFSQLYAICQAKVERAPE